MENLIIYLLKSTICLVVFSVFFRLLLMKETFFRFTRFTLILGLIVCSILPFVKLKFEKSYAFQQTIYQLEETLLPEKIAKNENKPVLQSNELAATDIAFETAVSPVASTERNDKTISWFMILVAVYWLGVAAMLMRFVGSFVSLNRLLRKSRKIDSEEYHLIITPENVIPFSFFRYIVLSEKDYRENPNEIILHEKMHIRKRHNIDVVFSELFLTVHWFNPMVWLLCRDLREIHEYEADNAVINAGIEAQKYQILLVKKAVGERRFTSVVNSFNQSKIKNRITMMLKKESSEWARLKVLFVVPLAVAALLAFAQPENTEEQFNDYVNRKNAMDYFLSVRKEQKDDYVAYLYISTNEQFFVINEAVKDAVSIRAIDLKDKSDLPQIFSELIAKKVGETTSTPIDFILGAENDTKMKNVSTVKEAMREAYDSWCGSVSNQRNIPLNKITKDFPLSITYTSVQANDPGDIEKLVQSNPFFYWEQVQKFCKEKGIEPKNLAKEFVSAKTNRNLLVSLINSKNQIMFQGISTNWLKTSEEASSDKAIEMLKSMIIEMMSKNKNNPIFFSLQTDVTASTAGVIHFINNTLPVAYEEALKEISEKENISLSQLMTDKPLLFVCANPRAFSKDSKSRVGQIKQNRNSSVIRITTQKESKEEMSYFRVVVYNNEEDASIVAMGLKALSDEPEDENIRQELVFGTPLNPVDAALVSISSDLSKMNLESVNKMLNKKFQPKKSYFVLNW